jgi:hypothetical protein
MEAKTKPLDTLRKDIKDAEYRILEEIEKIADMHGHYNDIEINVLIGEDIRGGKRPVYVEIKLTV